MTLTPDPVVITFPAPAVHQDGDSMEGIVHRLDAVTHELTVLKARLLHAAGDDRHLRATAHRLDDAAFTCARAVDELTGR